MSGRESVLNLLEKQHELSVKEIVQQISLSRQQIHSILAKLVEEGKVEKFGKSPRTSYRLSSSLEKDDRVKDYHFDVSKSIFLKKHFLLIDELGRYKEGLEGFKDWCTKRKLRLDKTIDEFIKTKEKYARYNDSGFISGSQKLRTTKGFKDICLNDIFYLDFYAIERFGKTRLGTLLHFAKQGQNKELMKIILNSIKPKIEEFIDKTNINAVGFVSPTIYRKLQIMTFLEEGLKISLPKLSINKVRNSISVPQKSLNKIEERIYNANHTFHVSKTWSIKRLLLIDDAVGSGATLNQIACKVKNKEIAEEVIGLAIVGSFKGFDVITDV